MKIVFFGTPYYVIPILEALHKAFREQGESPIVAVITQPPKPAGRKQLLEYSEVDIWAHKRDIKILRDLDIKNFPKADVGVLASYGNIIPKEIINHFPHGILVIHPSLLPQFRWGSPVPAALITNTNPTGVTIIKMDEKWDHGPIISQFKEEILAKDTYGTLRDRLFEKSADVLVQLLPAYLKGKIKLRPQDHKKASFARIIKKEDAFIPPEYLGLTLQGETFKGVWETSFIKTPSGRPFTNHCSPITVHNFIRAMAPWPIAWTNVKLGRDGVMKRLRILKAHLETRDEKRNTRKGKSNLSSATDHISSISYLVLDEVQLEGKNPTSWEQFKQGYPNASFS